MARFTDKTAFVTGGTSGIGRATVERLIAEGARVVTTGRDPDGVARVQAELGEAARVLAVDALDLDAQRRTVDEAAGILGGIDVAVLNAGVSDWRPVDAWDEAAFDRVFDVNVKAPFFALQALLPTFDRAPRWSSPPPTPGTAGSPEAASTERARPRCR